MIPAVWITEIYLLCCRLERIAQLITKQYPELGAPYLTNIKEKFGELRVYSDHRTVVSDSTYTDLLDQVVREIEAIQRNYRMTEPDEESGTRP